MEQIDWSKAPDWAIGHAIHATAMGVKEVWVGEDKYQQFDHSRPFPYGGTVGADSYHNTRRNQFAFETLRPTPWNGEGLPPVGSACIITPHNTIWGFSHVASYPCRVLAYHDDFVWVDLDGVSGTPVATRTDKVSFSQIRTQEQIAAEQREKAIKEMLATCGTTAVIVQKACEDLFDSGFRKFEIVPE